MSLFGKETPKIKAKYYYSIDYSDEAKKQCVGGNMNLRIFLLDSDNNVLKSEIFTDARMEEIKTHHIPIIIKAKHDIPEECMKDPENGIVFGRVEFRE